MNYFKSILKFKLHFFCFIFALLLIYSSTKIFHKEDDDAEKDISVDKILSIPLVYSWIIKNENLEKTNINEIILNTEKHPYLWNLVKHAIDNPEVPHYVFYYFEQCFEHNHDLSPENIDDFIKSNRKEIEKQNLKIKQFEQSLQEEFQKKLIPKFNIKFIHAHELFGNIENLYKKYNPNAKNSEIQDFLFNLKLLYSGSKKFSLNDHLSMFENSQSNQSQIYKKKDKLRNKIQMYILKILGFTTYKKKIGYRIDLLKLLGGLYAIIESNSSVLIADFDAQFEKLKVNFDSKTKIPKFSKWYDGKNAPKQEKLLYDYDLISEALIVFPNNNIAECIFLLSINFYNEDKNFMASIGNFLNIFKNFLINKKNLLNQYEWLQYFQDIDYQNLQKEFQEYPKNNLLFIESNLDKLLFLHRDEMEFLKENSKIFLSYKINFDHLLDELHELKFSVNPEEILKNQCIKKEKFKNLLELLYIDYCLSENQKNKKKTDLFPKIIKEYKKNTHKKEKQYLYEDLYFFNKDGYEFSQVNGSTWQLSHKKNKKINDILSQIESYI